MLLWLVLVITLTFVRDYTGSKELALWPIGLVKVGNCIVQLSQRYCWQANRPLNLGASAFRIRMNMCLLFLPHICLLAPILYSIRLSISRPPVVGLAALLAPFQLLVFLSWLLCQILGNRLSTAVVGAYAYFCACHISLPHYSLLVQLALSSPGNTGILNL